MQAGHQTRDQVPPDVQVRECLHQAFAKDHLASLRRGGSHSSEGPERNSSRDRGRGGSPGIQGFEERHYRPKPDVEAWPACLGGRHGLACRARDSRQLDAAESSVSFLGTGEQDGRSVAAARFGDGEFWFILLCRLCSDTDDSSGLRTRTREGGLRGKALHRHSRIYFVAFRRLGITF
uniref:Uncharacterized protein n=1 Tax=Chromera velia CCMP2878 TaxID=1169474 RepID=A0A0G4G3T8_9ALVE|eukprot:Cvel_4139.t1-p1 / transcript=Cvel_4139.t1 / gene=Cvel_4139 / organism=Chromera_velia_CCMP2878 / gene_product=hypothetical protein / transcript_product=hypothetical protein / location=Cvel_scaffold177:63741-66639(-) / protein_length=177 / sequence_SO=supercontig / SO=protein_coding / is_pseudo=false